MLFQTTPEGIMILEALTGRIIDVNAGLTDMLQCSRQEFLDQRAQDFFSMEDFSAYQSAVDGLRVKKHICHDHIPLKTKNGKSLNVTFDCHLFTSGRKEYVRCTIREAADSRAEDALHKSEEKYRQAFTSTSDVILMVDRELRITSITPSVEKLLGFKPEEMINRRVDELSLFSPSALAMAAANTLRVLAGESVSNTIYEVTAKDGSTKFGEITASPIQHDGVVVGMIAVARDITERRRIEDQMRQNEYFLLKSQEVAHMGSYTFEARTGLWSSSSALDKIFGIDTTYAKDIGGWLDIIHPDDRADMSRYLTEHVIKHKNAFKKQYRIISRSDSQVRWVYGLGELIFDDAGNTTRMIGTIQDITERKRMEEDIVKSELKYRTIVENSQEGIFQTSPHDSQTTVNHAFSTMLGYDSPEECAKTIMNIAEQVYVDSSEYCKVLEIIRREGSIRGYETEFYRKDKSRIWVNMSVSAVRDSEGGLMYYHGIVEDITPKKKLEQERQESIHRLRKSLGATINAMSATVEARDPYTAGHQRRVADLARAIATDMKLSRDQIDGIRLAGMIHDLGKISVPSEILTKPTRLTELEFELIKTHSEAGYNILKDIEFPWPIARIVLEHHERVNGSGYPQGLNGEDILLESKIIAVADVVEAISSHRPYRPAFGLEPALEEVAKNRGTLYDQVVADACVKLFRENRYKMPV
jgi:PAS domain S-box-containing protein